MAVRNDRRWPIRRVRHGDSFQYVTEGGALREPERVAWIESLAIPPAWEHVEIAGSSRAKVLARGRDAAGRRQAIYNPAWRRRRDREKFDRVRRFGEKLPALRAQVAKDLRRRRLTKPKVVACVIALIDCSSFRVGSAAAARESGAFGITTLRRRHTRFGRSAVTFEFRGKSGQQQRVTVRDPKLVQIVHDLHDMQGYELFRFFDDDGGIQNVDARHITEYVREHMGAEFSGKDFRTWSGSVRAFEELAHSDLHASQTQRERQRIIAEAVRSVAEHLGNTPAVARASYIDPRVLAVFEDPRRAARAVSRRRRTRRHRRYLTVPEEIVLSILARSKR